MIWIATAATFGLVVCLVVYFFGSRMPRPSVMERIGGHTVTVPHGRTIEDPDVLEIGPGIIEGPFTVSGYNLTVTGLSIILPTDAP